MCLCVFMCACVCACEGWFQLCVLVFHAHLARPARAAAAAATALVANTSCFVVAPIAGRPTSARVIAFLADLNAMAGFGSVRATASEDGTTVTIEQLTVPAGGWGTVAGVLDLLAHFPDRIAASGACVVV